MANEDYSTIKIWKETLPKLRLLAALKGQRIVYLIDRLIEEELEETNKEEEEDVTITT